MIRWKTLPNDEFLSKAIDTVVGNELGTFRKPKDVDIIYNEIECRGLDLDSFLDKVNDKVLFYIMRREYPDFFDGEPVLVAKENSIETEDVFFFDDFETDNEDKNQLANALVDEYIRLYRVTGNSMIEAGIMPGGFVVVDTAIYRYSGKMQNKIILARLNDMFLIKRFFKQNGTIKLISDNKDVDNFIVDPLRMKFEIVGVVIGTYCGLI